MTCVMPNTFRCRDYVRVIRPGFGNTESCGNSTTDDNQNQLEQGVPVFVETYSWSSPQFNSSSHLWYTGSMLVRLRGY